MHDSQGVQYVVVVELCVCGGGLYFCNRTLGNPATRALRALQRLIVTVYDYIRTTTSFAKGELSVRGACGGGV